MSDESNDEWLIMNDSEELDGDDDEIELTDDEYIDYRYNPLAKSIEEIKKAILKVNNNQLPFWMDGDKTHLDYCVRTLGNLYCIASGVFDTRDIDYMDVWKGRVIPFLNLLGLENDDCFYYCREKQNFFLQLGVMEAKDSNKKIVIYENLS